MKKTRTLASAGIALLTLTCLLAPTVHADTKTETAPMTAEQLIAQPQVAALNSYVYTIMDGKFTATGIASRANGATVNVEQIVGNGTLIRDQWDNDTNGSNAQILIYNTTTKQTCYRKATSKNWGNVDGDKRARWTCAAGLNRDMAYEMGMLAPSQAVRMLASKNPNLTYSLNDTYGDGSRIDIGIYQDGTKTSTLTYTLTSGNRYSYTMTNHDGAGGNVTYSLRPTMEYTLLPWDRMNKKAGNVSNLIPLS